MSKKAMMIAVLGAVLVCAPATARDRFDLEHGRGVDHHRSGHNRTGAWVGDGRSDWRGRHGGHHGHFSPRGQGGHHWGW